MAGGLASLPGFGWVPLKVYRPCPELAKAGISYVRRASGVLYTGAMRNMPEGASVYLAAGSLSRMHADCVLGQQLDYVLMALAVCCDRKGQTIDETLFPSRKDHPW